MKVLILTAISCILFPIGLWAQSISGTVTFKGEAKGTLFVYVRYLNEHGNKPVVLKRYENPKFPVKFELTSKDALVPGMPFKGPFKVYAKLAPAEGRLWSRKTIFAKGHTEDSAPVNVGDSQIEFEIK